LILNKIIDYRVWNQTSLLLNTRAAISVSAKDFRNSHLCRKWRNSEHYIRGGKEIDGPFSSETNKSATSACIGM